MLYSIRKVWGLGCKGSNVVGIGERYIYLERFYGVVFYIVEELVVLRGKVDRESICYGLCM